MRVLFSLPFALGLGCAATRTKDDHSSKPLLTIPVVFAEGFWFGNFTAGDATELSLLIDTGSSDVFVNPDLYKPSSESHTLNQTVSMSFITTKPDGCGEMILKSNVVTDKLGVGPLTATNQSIGTVIQVPQPNPDTITQFPGQGIIGLLGTSADDSSVGGTPFFQHLCDEGQVDECRFGLGLETSGTGSLTLGGVDRPLLSGGMATAPISGQQWIIEGGLPSDMLDVGVQQSMFLDSGTSNIIGNHTMVKALFDKLGFQSFTRDAIGCDGTLFGYYPCDSPPRIGFQVGNSTQVFFIEPEAFKMEDNGDNNCTATITGGNIGAGGWLVGQSWFQGKYIDFDVTGNQVGVANLH
ncbi:hypothetical protein MKX08_008819 [Trichoderma sp. CBMAI-0020]|nr:hypothetical protein MKX08_008819 [Trichoderma sp. CBMAI-0020]